jgi:hypothetical protein
MSTRNTAEAAVPILQGGGALGAYQAGVYETHSKNSEFSRAMLDGHWDAWRRDVETALTDNRWTGRAVPPSGMAIFDLAGDAT